MLHILLVDDEAQERKGIRFLINKFKLPLLISEAANGKLALAHLEKNQVDILLTDIKMPYMDGLELADAVQRGYPAVKTIIFSAYGEFEYAKKALQANAVSYLLKPIEVEEFQAVMNAVIADCRQRRRQEEQRQALRVADRIQRLFQELTGASFRTASLETEETLLAGTWFLLINIETRNSFFTVYENQFLRLVNTWCPYPYTYVNLYPNAAYLILHHIGQPEAAKVTQFADKLRREVLLVCQENCSLLLGSPFTDSQNLRDEAKFLRELRANIYESDSSVLVAKDLSGTNRHYAEGIEECREKIVRAISSGDNDEISLQINRLIQQLHQAQALSVIYLNHIFYDLLTRLYRGCGIHDSFLIQKRIEEVTGYSRIEELTAFFREILNEIAQTGERPGSYSLTERVNAIIETEYQKDIGLDYIGEKVNLSPAYLSFLYKQECGVNIIRHLSDYRMTKAKELLAGTNMKITEIAGHCGYDNPSYFNRLFKNLTGMTPKQYREQLERTGD